MIVEHAAGLAPSHALCFRDWLNSTRTPGSLARAGAGIRSPGRPATHGVYTLYTLPLSFEPLPRRAISTLLCRFSDLTVLDTAYRGSSSLPQGLQS